MNTKFFKLLIVPAFLLFFTACQKDEDTSGSEVQGNARIEITDAPIDDASVEGAFVTITEVKLDGKSVEGFNRTTIDLMAYQNGDTKLLSDAGVEAKSYSEVTLVLDFEEDAQGNSPGCYVMDNEGKKQKLESSSNEVRSRGSFQIVADQTTNLVLDFDLRKSVTRADNGADDQYDFVTAAELQSAVRLVQKDESGMVEGTCEDNVSDSDKIVVYAYKKGTYNVDTETEGQGSSDIEFAQAVTSAEVNASGNFELHFLEEGDYELEFISYKDEDNDGQMEIQGSLEFSLLAGIDLNTVSVNANSSVSLNLLVTGILIF